MSRIQKHLFVCANDRPTGGMPSCAARGATEVLAALQRQVGADPSLWGQVAVTPTGCLGLCYEGPVVVVYPDAVWYQGVTAGDAPALVEEHVRGGRPLARLRYEPPED